jgi:hypothetical protein
MSTFTGINDYVSQVQPDKPNLQFYSGVLQSKQSKYDANHSQLSGLYGSLLNADLTRDDNKNSRENFFKLADSEIQKITSMDLSLDANKTEAADLFQSIYKDKNLVKDMVWTQNYKDQLSKAEALKNCIDPAKCGGSYWEKGEQYMHYKAQEFKNAGANEVQSFEDVSYVPYNNIMEKALKYAKEAGINVSIPELSADGNYMVTTKNGPLAVQPLTSLFSQVMGDDPNLIKQFEVEAYVNRKEEIQSIMAEKGIDENQAFGEYLNKKGNAINDEVERLLNNSAADEDYINGRLEVIDDLIKKGKVVKDSDLHKEYETLQALKPSANQAKQYFELSKNALANTKNTKYLKNMGASLDQANGSILLSNQLNEAAKTLAYRDYEVTMEEDKFALRRQDHQYDVMLENQKASNNLRLEREKAILKQQYSSYGGDSTKDPKNKSITALIEEGYKAKYGSNEPKGAYQEQLDLVKADYEVAKKDLENSADNKGGDTYKNAKKDIAKYKKQLDFIEAKNKESVVKQKAQTLENENVTLLGQYSYNDLYQADRIKNKRTKDDYGKGNADFSKSSVLSNIIGGTQPSTSVRSVAEAEEKQQANAERTKWTVEDINNNDTLVQVMNHPSVTLEQKEWYDKKIKSGGVKNMTEKEKQLVVNRIESLKSQKFGSTELKPIKPSQLTTDSLSIIAESHPDKEVRNAYKALSKKPNLTVDERDKAAKRYNELIKSKTGLDVTDKTEMFTKGVQKDFHDLYTNIIDTKFTGTKSLNERYISEVKGTSEYEKIKDFALKYAMKNSSIDSRQGVRKYNNVKFQIEKNTFNTRINKITDEKLEQLLGDKYFSNALYEHHVKQKLTEPTANIKKISDESRKVMRKIETYSEYEKSLVKLKTDQKEMITKEFNKALGKDADFLIKKDGTLLSKKEYARKIGVTTVESMNRRYEGVYEAYSAAINATLKEKYKGVIKKSGLGSTTTNVLANRNVSLTNKTSPASQTIDNFLAEFQNKNNDSKLLFIKDKSGEFIKGDLNSILVDLRKKGHVLDVEYSTAGGRGIEAKTVDGVNTTNWEKMTVFDKNTKKTYIFNVNPETSPSTLYNEYQIPMEQKIFQLSGEKVAALKEDGLNSEIKIINTAQGIRFKGTVIFEGKEHKIQDIMREVNPNSESSEDYFFSDVFQAQKAVDDILTNIKSYEE